MQNPSPTGLLTPTASPLPANPPWPNLTRAPTPRPSVLPVPTAPPGPSTSSAPSATIATLPLTPLPSPNLKTFTPNPETFTRALKAHYRRWCAAWTAVYHLFSLVKELREGTGEMDRVDDTREQCEAARPRVQALVERLKRADFGPVSAAIGVGIRVGVDVDGHTTWGRGMSPPLPQTCPRTLYATAAVAVYRVMRMEESAGVVGEMLAGGARRAVAAGGC